MLQTFRSRISGIESSDNQDILTAHARDASLFLVKPELVVSPTSTEDVVTIVRAAIEARKKGENISLTARAAGTCMTGGPLTESVVVAFQPHMNRLIMVGDGFAVAEPGLFYRDFEIATLTTNQILPSFPASKELCAIGGMVANDGGGERSLSYGKTHRYVQELECVLDDGSITTFKELNTKELKEKKQLTTREGEIYRAMDELVTKNAETIRAAKPHVSKNSAGYALWRVRDEKNGTFNLAQLVTGAQGTLCLTTKMKLGLVTPKPYRELLIIFLKDLKPLGELVNTVLAYKPESFESYDDHTFVLALKLFPQIAKRLKGNVFSLLWRFLPELRLILTGGIPKMVLLAEFTGETQEEARGAAEAAHESLKPFRVSARLARNHNDAEKYWTMRHESFALLRSYVHGKHTAPFIDDLVVPPGVLPEFLPKLNLLLKEHADITYTIAGHVGDGNFHLIPLMDLARKDALPTIRDLAEKVFALVVSYGGSITGEHNDGLIRTSYLGVMYTKETVALFEETKRIFDPENLFNPGKKVYGDREAAFSHITPY